MMFYAIATLPLVRAPRGDGSWFQSWYADDSVAMCWSAGWIVCCYWVPPMATFLNPVRVT